MALIEIPGDVDERLRRVVPGYLKGDRDTTKRVRWVIEEYLRILGVTGTAAAVFEDDAAAK
jgi:hypothetical protein